MIVFVDTSVLVKLYIAEPGSERMREAAAQEDHIAASLLAFAESHATFARRHREKLLLAPELEELLLRFTDDWEELMQVPMSAEILAFVPGLCKRHPLRGADAIHLASALLLHQEGLEILFACSDGSLLSAAAAEGLAIFDPVHAA
ncbi:MAG: type II toxin-antitoxin system VapC family toxin [Thermoanaerobaculia bacterium]